MINENSLLAAGFVFEPLTGTYDLVTTVNDCASLVQLRPYGYYFTVTISGYSYPIRTDDDLQHLLALVGASAPKRSQCATNE